MITEPGLFEIEAPDYHSDPCPVPSLNNSTIGPLLECPRLAWQQHPRLNPLFVRKEATRLDLGNVAHKLLLGRGRGIQVIDAAGYRTKDAQAARDAARGAGLTPVLPDQLANAEAMVAALRAQLREFSVADGRDAFDLSTGKFEIGLFWQEPDNGPWCRNLIDRLRDDLPIWEIWDYKTTGVNINPDASLGIHVVEMGYDTQWAMQERGLLELYPALAGRLRFRLLFQQTEPPHLISVVEPDPATMTMARKKVQRAIDLWRECLAAQRWPGYPARVMPLRHAEFLAQRWLDRELREFDDGQAAPPAPKLKRRPGRPKGSRRPKPNLPVVDLDGG